ncbi:MAG: hypothetical protein JWN76_463 [Chitinophagaceae bacterium]|nr:hypothetical protein [Chitinophagaceae bacterium]
MLRCKILTAFFFILLLSSCGVRKYVNKQYPPVSSAQKKCESLSMQREAFRQIPSVDIGMRISGALLDSLADSFLIRKYLVDARLSIPNIDSLKILQLPALALGKQEIIINSRFDVYPSQNRFVKNLKLTVSGAVYPGISGDSLILSPAFTAIHLDDIRLKRWAFLRPGIKKAVNTLCRDYMDNINGQIHDFNVRIDYPPYSEIPLSQIIGHNDNIRVVQNDTFKLERKFIYPAVLVEPGGLLLLSAISDKKMDRNMPPKPAALLQSLTGICNDVAGFENNFAAFDSSFYKQWNLSLDSIGPADAAMANVQISYNLLSRVTNELLKDLNFTLSYNLNEQSIFPEKEILLKDIPRPDCDAIHFDCPRENCSDVLSNCGSCGWLDPLCDIRWMACQATNGLRYANCQANNAAKTVWCGVQLAAKKALCYAEIGLIFIYDNLFKDIGRFGGYAKVSGNIYGTISKVLPDGLRSLELEGTLQSDVNAEVKIDFKPSGVLGHLACTFPAHETFHINGIHNDEPGLDIKLSIEKVQQNNECKLLIRTDELTVPVSFPIPLLAAVLLKPGFVLNCGIGIQGAILVSSVMALLGNQDFKNYLKAALFGEYKMKFHQNLEIQLPPINISPYPGKRVNLNPAWGNNAIIYSRLK